MHNDFDFMCPPPVKPGCGDFGHKPAFPAPKPPMHGNTCWPKPGECNIAPYNKITFNNKREAVELLSNKDLHAGEIAFAYYYDNKTAHGINAIGAVGNIKVGAPNILFENSEDIEKWLNELSSADGELVADIKSIRVDIDNIFAKLSYIDNSNSKVDELDQTLNDVLIKQNDLSSAISEVQEDINNINDSLLIHTDDLAALEDYIKRVEDSIKVVSDSTEQIDVLNSSINTWIEKHEASAIIEHNLLRDEIQLAISDISTNFGNAANGMGAEVDKISKEFEILLATEINNVNESILSLHDELSDKIKSEDEKVKSELTKTLKDAEDNLKGKIDTLTQEVNNLSLKADGVDSEIGNAIVDVSSYLTTEIEAMKVEMLNAVKSANDRMTEHEALVAQSLANIKKEEVEYIESKVSGLNNELNNKINDLQIKVNTLESAINARFDTIISDYKSKITALRDDLESAMIKQKSALRTEYAEAEANQNRINDAKYELKGTVKPIIARNTGGLILDTVTNELSLDINAYGILHMNGVEYKLERNY